MPTKPQKNQPQTPDKVQNRDNFRSPRYSVKLLIPFVPLNITHIWECAAGDLHITKVLKENKFKVLSSDIRIDVDGVTYTNFLTDNRTDIYEHPYAIISNPPYSLKFRFIKKAIEYNIPFAFLIPFNFCQSIIEFMRDYNCEVIVPERRIDYITPNGLSGKASASQFHSVWFTRYFNLEKQLTFVDLSLKDKLNV